MQAQRDDGKKVFAIPHNSNESKGLHFAEATLSGVPIGRDYAETSASMEPLVEMMQVKGNSEVVPNFWPNDEFADFENAISIQRFSGRGFLKENFVRYGLGRGIKYNADLGVNPFKYGFVGGTDSHNGTPSNVEEDNYAVGSHGLADRTAEVRSKIGARWRDADLGFEPRRADRRLGRVQHPRRDLGFDARQGDLRHLRARA